MVFRQESNFYYLSGCTVPASYLLIAYQAGTALDKTPSMQLFIPKAESADIMWSIPPPTLEVASTTHDVTKTHYTSDLSAEIATLVKAFPEALFHTLPRGSPLFPTLSDQYPQIVLSADGAVTDAYLLSALHRTRLIKDAEEIALIRRANQISSRAHETVMRVLGKAVKGEIQRDKGADRPLLPGEWLIEQEAEAEAIFVASCRREGFATTSLFPVITLTSIIQCCSGLLANCGRGFPSFYAPLLLQ